MNIETIIDAYRNGDETKRLSLFLAYRDLREFFTSIEDESPRKECRIIPFPWNEKQRLSQAA